MFQTCFSVGLALPLSRCLSLSLCLSLPLPLSPPLPHGSVAAPAYLTCHATYCTAGTLFHAPVRFPLHGFPSTLPSTPTCAELPQPAATGLPTTVLPSMIPHKNSTPTPALPCPNQVSQVITCWFSCTRSAAKGFCLRITLLHVLGEKKNFVIVRVLHSRAVSCSTLQT